MIKKILILDEWKISLLLALIFCLVAYSSNIIAAILTNILMFFIYTYFVNDDTYMLLPDKLKPEFDIENFKTRCKTSAFILLLFPIIMFALGLITMSLRLGITASLIITFSPLGILFGFYLLILDFSAKILVTYNLKRSVTFKEYLPTLLLYVIFPFGLFATHKKVKSIVTLKEYRSSTGRL